MKRSARLEKFAELNAGIENHAGAKLATAQALYDKHYSQLEKLETYRLEYQEQLNSRLAQTQSAATIHDYHKFIASLNQAIAQQAELVHQCALKVEASRENWLSKKRDVTKMQRAAENLRHKERKVAHRQEQMESDELSLNKHTRSQQTDSFDL